MALSFHEHRTARLLNDLALFEAERIVTRWTNFPIGSTGRRGRVFCTAEDLANESDVEHKFLWPLLTSTIPTGLGYLLVDIEPSHPPFYESTRATPRSCHPDYVIVIAGIPVFIIEAKHPSQDVREGLREARLYAQELNAVPTGINPCLRDSHRMDSCPYLPRSTGITPTSRYVLTNAHPQVCVSILS